MANVIKLRQQVRGLNTIHYSEQKTHGDWILQLQIQQKRSSQEREQIIIDPRNGRRSMMIAMGNNLHGGSSNTDESARLDEHGAPLLSTKLRDGHSLSGNDVAV